MPSTCRPLFELSLHAVELSKSVSRKSLSWLRVIMAWCIVKGRCRRLKILIPVRFVPDFIPWAVECNPVYRDNLCKWPALHFGTVALLYDTSQVVLNGFRFPQEYPS